MKCLYSDKYENVTLSNRYKKKVNKSASGEKKTICKQVYKPKDTIHNNNKPGSKTVGLISVKH